MDAFTLAMSLTLAVAGVFLYRDYVQFLRGVHSVLGKVCAIQQVFVPQESDATGARRPLVKNGFYPVVEYTSAQGPIRFTAIDHNISGRFHVGDKLRLRVTKSRRSHCRTCKSFSALVILLAVLCVSLVVAALFAQFHLLAHQVLMASFVIAFCFSVLVIYVRDQDKQEDQAFSRSELGHAQLCLFEPTAFEKWSQALKDPVQIIKIRSSQLIGAICLTSACAMLILAIQPLSQLPF